MEGLGDGSLRELGDGYEGEDLAQKLGREEGEAVAGERSLLQQGGQRDGEDKGTGTEHTLAFFLFPLRFAIVF